MNDYVLVYVHKGQTAQLPTPPPQMKTKKWHKAWLRTVALYLLEKSITLIL